MPFCQIFPDAYVGRVMLKSRRWWCKFSCVELLGGGAGVCMVGWGALGFIKSIASLILLPHAVHDEHYEQYST